MKESSPPRAIGSVVALVFWACPVFGLAQEGQEPPAGKPLPVAVLPLDTKDIPVELGERLRSSAENELKGSGLFSLVPVQNILGELKQMEEKNIHLGECLAKATCVHELGEHLGAAAIFHLVITRAWKGATLTMSSFNATTGTLLRKEADFSGDSPAEMERTARWLSLKAAAPLLTGPEKSKGKLVVECAENDAEAVINGKSFGKQTDKRFKVTPGVFDVALSKEGFAPFHEVVLVKPGETRVVKANLEKTRETLEAEAQQKAAGTQNPAVQPVPGQPPETKPFLPSGKKNEPPRDEPGPSERKFYQTWWFWTVVGVAAVGVAGGLTAYFLVKGNGPPGVGGLAVTWE